MKIVDLIFGIIQIVFFLLSANKESNAEKKKEKEELRNEAKDAIARRDASAINTVINKLRHK